MIYTFGKATLAPGERLGYLALSPKMSISDRVALRESISRACTTGWSRPSSLAGHALKNMDSVLIDIGMLLNSLEVSCIKCDCEKNYKLIDLLLRSTGGKKRQALQWAE